MAFQAQPDEYYYVVPHSHTVQAPVVLFVAQTCSLHTHDTAFVEQLLMPFATEVHDAKKL